MKLKKIVSFLDKKLFKKKQYLTKRRVDAIWEGISVAEAIENKDVPVFDYNSPPQYQGLIRVCCQRQ